MALSPNGKTVASGSGSINGTVRLWNVKKRKVIARCTGPGAVCALCWSGYGDRVASISWDGTARVWDVKRGKTILTIKTGHRVWAVIYSPDSSKLTTGGREGDAVKIWDAKTGKLLTTLKHSNIVWSLAWTSDGKKLISGSLGLIRIFDTATWQQIAILEGGALVTAISLSPNNRLLVSASHTTARLWNLDTNFQVGPPLQHKNDLRSVTLSPDGKVLVTGCENNNAYTWDVHAILQEAGFDDSLVPIGTNIVSAIHQLLSH
jgi:WD40 repeat protein